MTLKAKAIPGAMALFWMMGCLQYGSYDPSDDSQVTSVQGISQSIKDKNPKYQLFCAAKLSDLKTPGTIHLLMTLDSLDASGDISLGGAADPKEKFCMLRVVAPDPAPAGIQWTAKGADNQALTGVYYQSNIAQVTDGKLTVKLYQTHSENGKETIDAVVYATFPTGSTLTSFDRADLNCGSTKIPALGHEITTQNSKIRLSFSLPKESFKDSTSTCHVTITVDGEAYKSSNLSLTPKSTDRSVSLETTVIKDAKSGSSP